MTDDEIKEKRTDIHYSSATDIANDLATTYNKLNVNNTVVKSIGTTLRKLGFKKRSRRCEGYESPIPLWCVKKIFEPKSYDSEEPEGIAAGDMVYYNGSAFTIINKPTDSKFRYSLEWDMNGKRSS